MKSNLNYEGYEYLNELNHNDRGNPHPQYIKWDYIYKFPTCDGGKYVKFLEFEKTLDGNYSALFGFKLIKLDHTSEFRYNDIILQIILENNTPKVKLFTLNNFGIVYTKVIAVSNYDSPTKNLKVELYYNQISSSDYFGFQPLFKNVFSSYYNDEFKINIISNIDSIPSDNQITVSVGETLMLVEKPSSKTSYGVQGQIACDGAFIYLCWKQNNWIRVAKDSTW